MFGLKGNSVQGLAHRKPAAPAPVATAAPVDPHCPHTALRVATTRLQAIERNREVARQQLQHLDQEFEEAKRAASEALQRINSMIGDLLHKVPG